MCVDLCAGEKDRERAKVCEWQYIPPADFLSFLKKPAFLSTGLLPFLAGSLSLVETFLIGGIGGSSIVAMLVGAGTRGP